MSNYIDHLLTLSVTAVVGIIVELTVQYNRELSSRWYVSYPLFRTVHKAVNDKTARLGNCMVYALQHVDDLRQSPRPPAVRLIAAPIGIQSLARGGTVWYSAVNSVADIMV